MVTLTKALTSANDLLQSATDNLRAVRDKSDASLQTSLDGLIEVLNRALLQQLFRLQDANDSIHGALNDAKKDLEEDTNVLNIDSEAALQSVTSHSESNAIQSAIHPAHTGISAPSEKDAAVSDASKKIRVYLPASLISLRNSFLPFMAYLPRESA